MTKTEGPHFYNDVDRARYRANWSCLVWFFVLVLIAVGVFLFVSRKLGWL